MLKLGGLIGMASVEYEGVMMIAGSQEPLLRKFYAVREKLWRLEGIADPRLGKIYAGCCTRLGLVKLRHKPTIYLTGARLKLSHLG